MFKSYIKTALFLLFIPLLFLGSNFLSANYILGNENISLFLIGLHRGVASNSFDNTNNVQQDGVLYLLKSIKTHASVSIISMLEFSAMKEVTLDKYLNDTDQLLTNVGFSMSALRQDIGLLESDMNDCLDEKDLYDRQFFESIALYDQEYMDESLQKSINAQKCAGENRIKMNAKTVLFDQLSYYYDFVKIKYDYVQSQKNLIIRNFDFIKNGLLDELVTTKEVLNTLGN